MQKNQLIARTLLLAGACCWLGPRCVADEISLEFGLNTSPLIGHAAGPFSLSFQLIDGSGLGDSNNTALLSNFQFGVGGSPTGTATLLGGASGDLSSGVTLVDSQFLNLFTQSFTPGGELMFTLNLSKNVDIGGTPDEFSFSILDRNGTELPTLGGFFFNVFLAIDIDSASPSVQIFASDPSQVPAGGGSSIDTGTPLVNVVPEPGMAPVSMCLGLGILLIRKRFGTARPSS